jgi:hypothetical protein
MIRRVLNWLFARRDDDGEAEDKGENSSRFVPSRLDSSVRYAHGGSAEEMNREMAQIEAKAEVLEDQHGEK